MNKVRHGLLTNTGEFHTNTLLLWEMFTMPSIAQKNTTETETLDILSVGLASKGGGGRGGR